MLNECVHKLGCVNKKQCLARIFCSSPISSEGVTRYRLADLRLGSETVSKAPNPSRFVVVARSIDQFFLEVTVYYDASHATNDILCLRLTTRSFLRPPSQRNTTQPHQTIQHLPLLRLQDDELSAWASSTSTPLTLHWRYSRNHKWITIYRPSRIISPHYILLDMLWAQWYTRWLSYIYDLF